MKYIIMAFCVLSFYACSSKQNKKQTNEKDSTSLTSAISDSQLIVTSEIILTAFEQKNFNEVAKFIHPALGIRFSPYAFIDTSADRKISKSEFLASIDNKALLDWGQFDGSGDPIEMTYKEYFNRFVYDVDFLNKSEVSVNTFVQRGNTTNNIKEAYPNCSYVEYFVVGINPKVEGMDWRAIRLVFKTINGQIWLIGMVHDEWTA